MENTNHAKQNGPLARDQGLPYRRGRGYRAPAEVTAVFILPYPCGKPGNRGNRAVTGD
uniref:Transposon protein, putative, unclassified n=1 Tax=Oryza sativa subsp. japonica TaxID=39947 RepID=Q2QMH9_ORYSJ|nr:transposon protein, putative, unclassified [Oryza sativa Japonica Group]